MFKRYLKFILVLVFLVFTLSACSLTDLNFLGSKKTVPAIEPTVSKKATSSPKITKKILYTNKLKKFANYQDLAKFLNKNIPGNTDSSPLFKVINSNLATSSLPNNYLSPAPLLNSLAINNKKNIIKSAANYLYVLAGQEISIIDVSDSTNPKILSKIIFKTQPQSLFMSGNFLIVYGNDDKSAQKFSNHNFRNKNIYTFLKVFDISDPDNPKQTRDLSFEGYYLKAQLIGDYIYFLTATPGNSLINNSVLPQVLENGEVLATLCRGGKKCFVPDLYYFDIPYDAFNFVNLSLINFKDNTEELSGQAYIVNNQENFYLDSSSLVISYKPSLNSDNLKEEVKRTLFYSKLIASDRSKIDKIESSPDFILNDSEKKIKISQIINNYLLSLSSTDQEQFQKTINKEVSDKLKSSLADTDKTFIYKMSFKDNKIFYQAAGQVRGLILNNSALEQSGDYLRLVSVTNPEVLNSHASSTSHYTNIYILGPNLSLVGSLENLASNEAIKDVRFLGNRLYLITKKATDPIFVINLNNPQKPSVLGAVKVPGISNYLQALDDNGNSFAVLSHQGKVVYDDGSQEQGMILSLFDFSNLSKPQEVASYLIGDSSSNSMLFENHEDFFYSPSKNILVFPARLYKKNGHLDFSGALVFNLKDKQLNLLGKIDHSSGGYFNQTKSESGFNYYNNTVRNSLIYGDDLLTLSNKFLKFNNLNDLHEVASLKLNTLGDSELSILSLPNLASSSASSTLPLSATTTITTITTDTSTNASTISATTTLNNTDNLNISPELNPGDNSIPSDILPLNPGENSSTTP